jgi:hypothetical protein
LLVECLYSMLLTSFIGHIKTFFPTNYNHVLMVGVMSLIRYGFFLDFWQGIL